MTIAELIRPDAPPRFRYLVSVALVLATAFGLAAVGAFGTYMAIQLPVRLLHFSITGLLIGSLVYVLTAYARRRFFAGALPYWAVLVIAAGTAPPGALLVYQLLRLWAPHVLPYVSYGELTAQVLTINLFIGSAAWLLRLYTSAPNDARTDAAALPAPATVSDTLRSRLPLPLRQAAILSLSAEDHYVRVRTDRGAALILMNLSAAVASLGPDAGARIHRSHWVARELAARAPSNRQGIRLDDDTVLPVSRAGRKLLNAL